jgi:hypothetical protein
MADIIDIDGGDVKRRALREIKWLSNSLRGMMELADELADVADLQKEATALRVEIEAMQSQSRGREGRGCQSIGRAGQDSR